MFPSLQNEQIQSFAAAALSAVFQEQLAFTPILVGSGPTLKPECQVSREPRLIGITLALSVTFLLPGSTVQHMALLNRQMRFGAIAIIQVSSMVAGVAVGIGMALLNWGYWSLVGMNVTLAVTAFLLTWSACHWRPQLPRLTVP